MKTFRIRWEATLEVEVDAESAGDASRILRGILEKKMDYAEFPRFTLGNGPTNGLVAEVDLLPYDDDQEFLIWDKCKKIFSGKVYTGTP